MSRKSSRGISSPFVLTGEAAEKLLHEIENPTEPTAEQKQFFREVMAYGETQKGNETFKEALAYIKNDTFSEEQRATLQQALQHKQ